jgi:hypothetical protein
MIFTNFSHKNVIYIKPIWWIMYDIRSNSLCQNNQFFLQLFSENIFKIIHWTQASVGAPVRSHINAYKDFKRPSDLARYLQERILRISTSAENFSDKCCSIWNYIYVTNLIHKKKGFI